VGRRRMDQGKRLFLVCVIARRIKRDDEDEFTAATRRLGVHQTDQDEERDDRYEGEGTQTRHGEPPGLWA
jgi:hypothetical protein